MAALVLDIACFILIVKGSFPTGYNNSSFTLDKCCLLTLCLLLMESNWHSDFMSSRTLGPENIDEPLNSIQIKLCYLSSMLLVNWFPALSTRTLYFQIRIVNFISLHPNEQSRAHGQPILEMWSPAYNWAGNSRIAANPIRLRIHSVDAKKIRFAFSPWITSYV